MSFGKRLRAQRHTGVIAMMAIAATLGLGAASATPAPAASVASTAAQAPHEFADTSATEKRATKTVQNRVKGGSAWKPDSRKARRRWIMVLAGRPNTGRQWVRTRRELRQSGGSFLLNTPAWQLEEMAHEHGRARAA